MSWIIETRGEGKSIVICPAGHRFATFTPSTEYCTTCKTGGFYKALRETLERLTAEPWIIEKYGKSVRFAYNLELNCKVGAWWGRGGKYCKIDIYVNNKSPAAPGFEVLLERELAAKLGIWLEKAIKSGAGDSAARVLGAVDTFKPAKSPILAEFEQMAEESKEIFKKKKLNPADFAEYSAWEFTNNR